MRTLVANSFHQIDSSDLVAGKRDLFANAGFYDCAFFGTLAPFFRASESPIAIACLRLFTEPPLPPFPERRVPFFFRRTALSTDLPAALPYLRLPDFLREPALFRPAITSSQKHVCDERSFARNAKLRCGNPVFRCWPQYGVESRRFEIFLHPTLASCLVSVRMPRGARLGPHSRVTCHQSARAVHSQMNLGSFYGN